MAGPALPLPYETPPVFEIDFDAFFRTVEGHIQNSRKRRSQPLLVPNNQILVGKETLPQQISSPSIRIVPGDVRYTASDYIPDNTEPRTVYSQWLSFEAHCWGQDDPAGLKLLYGFSTALELGRQLIVALVDSNIGPANVHVLGGSWVQEVNVNRQGRVLVLNIEIETWVTRDPAIQVPAATSTTPGVTTAISVEIQPSGTVATTFTAPP